jgi:hypothetical protein
LPYNDEPNTSMIHNSIDDVNVNCNQLNNQILNDVELIHRNSEVYILKLNN